ncbi:MAG: translation initiation factor [Verrucomicrobiota bacterium]
MGRKKQKVSTDTAGTFGSDNPFASLDSSPLPKVATKPAEPELPDPKKKTGMRVEIRREKSGKGGKTVTTLQGLTTLDPRSRESLLFDLKKRIGTGGTGVPGGIQLQGDCREAAERILEEKGFRPIRAGG